MAGIALAAVVLLLGAGAPARADCCVCGNTGGNFCGGASVSCSDTSCATTCAGNGGSVVACCSGGDCSNHVADSCGSGTTYCQQMASGSGGACDGTCVSPPTATPTDTPTVTPTITPTATPTNTPLALGQPCISGTQCASTFCASGVCCNEACTGPNESCNRPGSVGICVGVTPAPAISSHVGMALAVALAGLGVVAVRRRTLRR